MNSKLKKSVRLTALALSLVSVAAHADMNIESIYGTDSRKDLYEITDAKTLKLADSTVALIDKGDITITGSTAKLKTESYGQSQGLCTTERFFDQGTAAFCSGSLIGEDLVLTAGHCVTDATSCANVRFVFGFSIRTQGADPTTVSKDEVYGCSQIIKREQVGTGADYGLIKLDRKVTNHTPLTIKRAASVVGGKLLVIGQPTGLPTKVADGKVRAITNPGFILTNLDTFAGNSGSAVFDATTGQVEGILVRGDADFRYDSTRNCTVATTFPEDGARGEDVTRVSVVTPAIDAYLAAQHPTPAPSHLPRPVH